MIIAAVLSEKGGTGKTTTAIHWVYWLTQSGKSVLLIDSDPQQSATAWGKFLNFNIRPILDPVDLLEFLTSPQDWDWIIMDSPPGKTELTQTILRQADQVLVPCRAGEIDLRSANTTFRMIRAIQAARKGLPKVGLFLNAVQKHTTAYSQAVEIIEKIGFPYLDSDIRLLQPIISCPGQGKTVFNLGAKGKDAADEYNKLFQNF